MELVLVVAGVLAVVGLVAWRLRRSQRDTDEVDQAEFRPPLIHGGGGPH